MPLFLNKVLRGRPGTLEEVTARNLKGLNIRFTPCRELQNAVNAAQLMAADSL